MSVLGGEVRSKFLILTVLFGAAHLIASFILFAALSFGGYGPIRPWRRSTSMGAAAELTLAATDISRRAGVLVFAMAHSGSGAKWTCHFEQSTVGMRSELAASANPQQDRGSPVIRVR